MSVLQPGKVTHTARGRDYIRRVFEEQARAREEFIKRVNERIKADVQSL